MVNEENAYSTLPRRARRSSFVILRKYRKDVSAAAACLSTAITLMPKGIAALGSSASGQTNGLPSV